MYVITGATSNTGSVIAHKLLDSGKSVRVIGRSLEKLKPFVDKGAVAFVAEPFNAEALTEAFSGTTAAWIMLQPNYIPDSPDFAGFQRSVIETVTAAIRINKVPYAVTLSSWGAHQNRETGPVLGLHNMEVSLDQISSLNVMHLRAGYFMENTLSYISSIIKHGNVIGPFDQDLKLPFISTFDIGSAAASVLTALSFRGKNILELHGQRGLSIREATTIIGNAIGKPGLTYNQYTVEQFGKDLHDSGVSQNVMELMKDVVNAMNTQHIHTIQERSVQSTTATTFEQFVQEQFLPAYRLALSKV